MRKSGGCGKTFSFFMGVLVGIFVVILSVGGFALWAYNNISISRIEKTFNVEIGIGDEEFRNKAIKDLIPEVSELMNKPVGEIASALGYTIDTNVEIAPASGTEPAKYADLSEAMNIVLKGQIYDVETNLQKMIDHVTFGYAYKVLNEPMDLPNIKLFTKFRDVKVTNIGNIIDQITVADVLEPNHDEAGNEVPFTGVLGAISDKTLTYLMKEGNMEKTINELKLKEVIEIDENDTGVMGALKNLTIGELTNNNIIDALNSKKLSDILNITATSGVVAKLKDVTIGDISAGNIDEEIKSLKLSEVIDITDTSGVIFALRDKTIGELNADAVMALQVSDVYTITDTSGVMFAIKDWTLGQMTGEQFKTLKINQLITIDSTDTGILASIAEWRLSDFTEANLQNLTLSKVLNITATSGIMYQLKDLKLAELTENNIKEKMEPLRLEEVINISGAGNKVWDAIKTSTIGGLNETLSGLTLSQFIEPNGTGADEGKYVGLLGYLITETNDPLISDMGDAIDTAVENYMKDVTIGELIDNGVINEPTGYTAEEMIALRAMKLVEFINNNLSK